MIELEGHQLALVNPEYPWMAFCFNNLQFKDGSATFDYSVVVSMKAPAEVKQVNLDFDAMADELITEWIKTAAEEIGSESNE